ncbi:MAG: (Na+)-NQR maturation NqrM, partial [Gammaproteobacteria bacterium]|nr:(Na+)-NQR maturation NqrM [Gammaproteobacteria bacterium]
MSLFFISVLVICLVMAGMAVGVMNGRPPIKGSCGGMGALGIDTACEICGGNPQRCDEQTRDPKAAATRPELYYSAENASPGPA